jgi:hypothetical protein
MGNPQFLIGKGIEELIANVHRRYLFCDILLEIELGNQYLCLHAWPKHESRAHIALADVNSAVSSCSFLGTSMIF